MLKANRDNDISLLKDKIILYDNVVKETENKLDKVENDEKNREVLAEDAEKICSENNVLWGGEFSAKNFNDNQLTDYIHPSLNL